MTYRVGNHHGVTIVREDDDHRCGRPDHDCARGHLVAVVVNGDQALAERICTLLNGRSSLANATGAELLDELRKRGELDDDEDGVTLAVGVAALRAGLDTYTLDARRADYTPDDSCTGCTAAKGDPDCPVHQGRKPRGPKPPPLGAGCICDGSGRTCPRHGAVM